MNKSQKWYITIGICIGIIYIYLGYGVYETSTDEYYEVHYTSGKVVISEGYPHTNDMVINVNGNIVPITKIDEVIKKKHSENN